MEVIHGRCRHQVFMRRPSYIRQIPHKHQGTCTLELEVPEGSPVLCCPVMKGYILLGPTEMAAFTLDLNSSVDMLSPAA